MSFLSSLIRPRVQNSDLTSDLGWEPRSSSGGIRVDEDSAMSLVSVYACVTLISDAIRAMPVDVYQRGSHTRSPVDPPEWTLRPNRYQTWGQFLDYVLHSLLTNGNAYLLRTSHFPLVLEVVHPDDVEVEFVEEGGVKEFTIRGETKSELNYWFPGGDVLHILGHTGDGVVGLSPIEQAKQAIETGLQLKTFANKFFENGAVISGALEMPTGSIPTEPQLEALAREFKRRYGGAKNAHRPVVLANGATYKPIAIPNDQAQFIESTRMSVGEIAQLFRVPPHLIGDVERSTSWGTGIEQQNIGFVQYTLMPWLTRLEDAFNQLLPSGQFLKFNVSSLLRGDQKARFEAYQIGVTNGFTTRNEVRSLEDLPPLEGGDAALVPLNLAVASSGDGVQASTRELTEMIQKIYLGVGKVLTADEAREILNREGADLPNGFEPFPLPAAT